uniref:Uncharacterized protein n=1 Tax=Oryza barthii TaxID=65489 RepID=A0A0D3HLU1_9ORYZ
MNLININMNVENARMTYIMKRRELGGYNQTHERRDLAVTLSLGYLVHWNVGVGPAASFLKAITSLAVEAIREIRIPFDPVIKVQLMEPPPEEREMDQSFVMSLEPRWQSSSACSTTKNTASASKPTRRLAISHGAQ